MDINRQVQVQSQKVDLKTLKNFKIRFKINKEVPIGKIHVYVDEESFTFMKFPFYNLKQSGMHMIYSRLTEFDVWWSTQFDEQSFWDEDTP